MSLAENVRPFEVVQGGGNLSRAQKHEARLFALQVVRDPAYRARLLQDARHGKLPPAVHTMLWHYAYGKPVEQIEVRESSLEDLSNEELAMRARAIADGLLQARLTEEEAVESTDRELRASQRRFTPTDGPEDPA
jgi:hypothetical protein